MEASLAVRAGGIIMLCALSASASVLAQECRRGTASTDTAFERVALAARSRDPFASARDALLAGRADSARVLLARDLGAELGDGERARGWSLLALAYARSGEFAPTRAAVQRMESFLPGAGPDRAGALLVAGVALAEIGDGAAALASLRRATALADAGAGDATAALALVDAAAIEAAREAPTLPEAVAAARRATAALPDAALRASLALTLANALAGNRRLAATAHAVLVDAYADASSAQRPAEAAQALGLIGTLQFASGAREESARTLARAVALAKAADSDAWSFRWSWMLGRAERARGNPVVARGHFARAVELLEESKARFALGTAASARIAWREVYIDLADANLRAAAGGIDASARQVALSQARDALELSRAAEIEDFFNDPCISARGGSNNTAAPDSRVAVLYPVVLADRLELLLQHHSGLEQFTVAATAESVTASVQQLRGFLEKRSTRQYLTPARRLHAQLIAPLEAHLARLGVTTLVIVPDGVLRTVPFAALHDGKTFLVERYTLATTPAASLTQARALAPARIRALLTGLTEARQGFAPLPGVGEELDTVATLLHADVYRDREFSLQRLQSALSTLPVNLLHVASHGQFSRDPAESFLLTFDGRLTLAQLRQAIAAGKLREEPLELLVLSACHTASGDERAALGLAGVALASGARSALASLWAVSDESTTLLMTTFYNHLARGGMTKAAALRQAQLDVARDDRFSHPAYWGAFLMIGNWL